MIDQLGRSIALGFRHCLQDARLGHPVQVILRRRFPAGGGHVERHGAGELVGMVPAPLCPVPRSEEHTSELQSLMRISYAVFCSKNKKSEMSYQTLHKRTEIITQ